MIIDEWGKKWNIAKDIVNDLKEMLGTTEDELFNHNSYLSKDYVSEAAVLNLVKAEASKKGARLWRNNVGAAITKNGMLRYGLANDSSKINAMIKSADLIGIKPVVITPDHVGCVIGQFLSREIKRSDWKYTGDAREEAQLRWIELIVSLGGDAAFATNKGTIK